jgi:NAD(P)-dependent dehydrogenase (short-subunit alcohol dehydrogenase family)
MTGRVGGKVAIVTGAASGIGAVTAQLLAEHGASVVVADIDSGAAERCAAKIRMANGSAVAIGFDLGDEASISALVEQVCDEFGGLDILLNNAAATRLAAFEDGAISKARASVWDETLRINVRGTMLATRLAAEKMIYRGGGSIINMSSVAAVQGDLGHAAYGASKSAINAITAYAATEFGKSGVRVNAIAPGLIVTEIAHESGHAESLTAIMERNHLTPRVGRPMDVAYMVLYLASDESEFVTGSVMRVDGGLMTAAPYVSELHALSETEQASLRGEAPDRARRG